MEVPSGPFKPRKTIRLLYLKEAMAQPDIVVSSGVVLLNNYVYPFSYAIALLSGCKFLLQSHQKSIALHCVIKFHNTQKHRVLSKFRDI